jgi:hypothetical protein
VSRTALLALALAAVCATVALAAPPKGPKLVNDPEGDSTGPVDLKSVQAANKSGLLVFTIVAWDDLPKGITPCVRIYDPNHQKENAWRVGCGGLKTVSAPNEKKITRGITRHRAGATVIYKFDPSAIESPPKFGFKAFLRLSWDQVPDGKPAAFGLPPESPPGQTPQPR